MKKNIERGDKIKIKVENKWKAFEVVSYDATDGWITFKSPEQDGKDFVLNTVIHQNHIRLPVPTVKKAPAKKKPRKKRKPKKTLKQRIKK